MTVKYYNTTHRLNPDFELTVIATVHVEKSAFTTERRIVRRQYFLNDAEVTPQQVRAVVEAFAR